MTLIASRRMTAVEAQRAAERGIRSRCIAIVAERNGETVGLATAERVYTADQAKAASIRLWSRCKEWSSVRFTPMLP